MADVVKCPVCGENNLSDQEFCQYCQSRLKPLTGSLKGTDSAIKPGQAPTKKNTAELEPILPQWLRDARDSARKSAEDDAVQAGRNPQESFSPSSPPDLLAGLRSQSSSDEEETPDWLANITGAAPKAKKPQADSPEVRWVELGGAKDFAQEESKEEPFTPAWLTGLTPTGSQPEEKDELTDWLKQAGDIQQPQQSLPQPSAFEMPSESGDTPDWLKNMAAESPQEDELFSDTKFSTVSSSDSPDWLRQMAAEDESQKTDSTSDAPDWLHQMAAEDESQKADSTSDAPDWLRQMATEDESQKTDSTSDAPDWLHKMAASDQNDDAAFVTPSTLNDAPATSSIDTPDWLRAMGDVPAQSAESFNFDKPDIGQTEVSQTPAEESLPTWMQDITYVENEEPSQTATPAWLKEESGSSNTGDEASWLASTNQQAAEHEQTPAQDEPTFGDIPSWLKAAAPQQSLYEEPPTQAPEMHPAMAEPESTDWLNAFKSVDAAFEPPPSAFTTDSQASEDIDALFADMPDWLSNSTDSPATTSAETPATNAEALTPGELPSWVQAMRPVDTGSAGSSRSAASVSRDQTLESRGALAGLQGVLPSVPGYTPTSKPKAYSIKLRASEEQQAHAALLEQILAAETAPVPIASFSALTNSRSLRWFLSAALLAIVITVLFMKTQIFPLPVGVPREINGAIQVSQLIPDGAPVLVAFDYEPARAGEMETVAAPLFNLMKQPNLTFISTNETGSILAERFISGPLADVDQSGIQYVNLGYLPGGQMGIRAFAQNPLQTSQLQGVTSLADFRALIIITDSAESARSWIEQVSSTTNAIPMVVISSAQAAPMIQPYYESQQIIGLVSGLYGAAVFEQNNGGLPGASRNYWDAYSIAMLLSMILIVGGGLVNLGLSLRDRAAMREAK
jgi:hypothetical protein